MWRAPARTPMSPSQLAFIEDLKAAAATALKATTPGEGLTPTDRSGNPWAVFDHYIDRVAIACVNQLTPKFRWRGIDHQSSDA